MKQNELFNQKITELKAASAKYLTIATPIKDNLNSKRLEEARMFNVLYKVLSDTSGVETGPDISKPAFVDAVTQWRRVVLSALKKTRTAYALVSIDPLQFSESIKAELSALPINVALYKEWASVIAKLKAPSTGALVFDALVNNTGTIWSMTTNIEALEKHYNKNKKVYKEYENDIGNFRDETLPSIAIFLEAIKASTAPNDLNLPENVVKREKEEKEREKEEKAKRKDFDDQIKAWIMDCSKAMVGIQEDSINEIYLESPIDVVLLGENLARVLEKSSFNTGLACQYIFDEVMVKASKAITLQELKDQTIEIASNFLSWNGLDKQFEVVKTEKFLMPSPYSMAEAFTFSAVAVSADSLEVALEKWKNRVVTIVTDAQEKYRWLDSLDPNLLQSNLSRLFNAKIKELPIANLIYKRCIEKEIGKKKAPFLLFNRSTPGKDDMQDVWINILGNISKSQIAILYKELVGRSPQLLLDAISVIPDSLPSAAMIIQELKNSRFVEMVKVLPKPQQNLVGTFRLEPIDSTEYDGYFIEMSLNIPLKYKRVVSDQGEDFIHVVPISDSKKLKTLIEGALNYNGYQPTVIDLVIAESKASAGYNEYDTRIDVVIRNEIAGDATTSSTSESSNHNISIKPSRKGNSLGGYTYTKMNGSSKGNVNRHFGSGMPLKLQISIRSFYEGKKEELFMRGNGSLENADGLNVKLDGYMPLKKLSVKALY